MAIILGNMIMASQNGKGLTDTTAYGGIVVILGTCAMGIGVVLAVVNSFLT